MQKVLDGQPIRSVSRELAVTKSQIQNWRAALDKSDGKHSGTELIEAVALKKLIEKL